MIPFATAKVERLPPPASHDESVSGDSVEAAHDLPYPHQLPRLQSRHKKVAQHPAVRRIGMEEAALGRGHGETRGRGEEHVPEPLLAHPQFLLRVLDKGRWAALPAEIKAQIRSNSSNFVQWRPILPNASRPSLIPAIRRASPPAAARLQPDLDADVARQRRDRREVIAQVPADQQHERVTLGQVDPGGRIDDGLGAPQFVAGV